jgi:hypothetical protein
MRLFALTLLLTTSTSPVWGQDSTVATPPRDSAVRGEARRWNDSPAARYKRTTIGLVAGVNFATWSGDDAGDALARRTGFHAGLMITKGLSRVASVQLGAMYSQEGTAVETTPAGAGGSIKVDYIRVPLVLKLGTYLTSSRVRPYVLAGPSLGIKVNCRIEATSGSQSAAIDCDDPAIGLNLTTTDIGLLFGAGVDLGRASVGVRFQPGIRSIDDTNNDAAEVHNNLLALTAGYAF